MQQRERLHSHPRCRWPRRDGGRLESFVPFSSQISTHATLRYRSTGRCPWTPPRSDSGDLERALERLRSLGVSSATLGVVAVASTIVAPLVRVLPIAARES